MPETPAVPATPPELSPQAKYAREQLEAMIAARNTEESFIGAGRYLAINYDHSHDVTLNAKGDGTTSPPFGYLPDDGEGDEDGDDDDHVHEVIGGRCMSAAGRWGYTHTHCLDPAHAADESIPAPEGPEQPAEGNPATPAEGATMPGPDFILELRDEHYHVTLGLCPVPGTVVELDRTLAELTKLPLAPETLQEARARVAGAAKSFLAEADLEARFPGLTPTEAPVVIALDQENYGLVYTAVQQLEQVTPIPGSLVSGQALKSLWEAPEFSAALQGAVQAGLAPIQEILVKLTGAEVPKAPETRYPKQLRRARPRNSPPPPLPLRLRRSSPVIPGRLPKAGTNW